MAAGLTAIPQLSGGVPKGYLRVLVFNHDSVLVSQRTRQLRASSLNAYDSLQVRLLVPQDGYVTAYVGNESDVDVYFDDVTVEHRPGLQVQENQYDPWGLSLAGLDYTTPGIQGLNQYQYNGKEKQTDLGLAWNDYDARFFEPQIGRSPVVDPLLERHYSANPYAYCLNNPTNMVDPDGRDAIFTISRDKRGNITGVTVSSTIYIQGNGASVDRASALTKAATNYFKSKTADGVTVSFNLQYAFSEGMQKSDLKAGENLLNFSAQPDDGEYISNVENQPIGSITNDSYEQTSGINGHVYGSGKNNQTVFHETLHLLGLYDRYSTNQESTAGMVTSKLPGYENDIMSTDNGGNSMAPFSLSHYSSFAAWTKKVAKQNAALGPIGDRFINTRMIDINKNGTLRNASLNWIIINGKIKKVD